MFVTLYLAAALSAAPVPATTAVYHPEKKPIPAQMVVLRVSRGSYGMRGCRTVNRGRAGCSMPCYTPSSSCSGSACHGAIQTAPGAYPQQSPLPLPPPGEPTQGSPSDQPRGNQAPPPPPA